VQTTSKLLIIDFSVLLTPSNSDTNLPYFIPKYGLTSIYLNVSTKTEKADAKGKNLISSLWKFPVYTEVICCGDPST